MRKAVLVLALALTAPAIAAGLSKYKDWADSPQAYFLSKGERDQWLSITTNEAAEKFIADYQAARGKGFAAAIQSRIDAADKTYKTGKLKGARSPLGKTLVLLGAPNSTSRASKVTKDKKDMSAADSASFTGGRVDPTVNVGGPGVNTMRGMQPQEPALIRWIYSDSSVPLGAGVKELTIDFLEDPAGNITFKDPAEAEAIFQKVIAYWAPKPKP